MPAPQAIYWLLTIPQADFDSAAPPAANIQYIRGQLETGAGGYIHWQILAVLKKKATLSAVKLLFGRTAHAEPSRSAAADEYVWKEETRVEGTQFEHGQRALKRNSDKDWDAIRASIIAGDMDAIPSDVLIRNYSSICRMRSDYSIAPFRPAFEQASVYWGVTGAGKSHRAWAEALALGPVYIKSPNTKWWDGYRGELNVIIDEFCGLISISYLKLWMDKYPHRVEVKGGTVALLATNFWILSNNDPATWYPTDPNVRVKGQESEADVTAIMRRMNITHFGHAFGAHPL